MVVNTRAVGVCAALIAALSMCSLSLYLSTCNVQLRQEAKLKDELVERYVTNISSLELEIQQLKGQLSIESTHSIAGMIQRIQPSVEVALAYEIEEAVNKYAERFALPPELVVHLVKRESNFNPRAVSSVGAVGLMQIYTKWHMDKLAVLGIKPAEVYEIDNNIHLGCWILRGYLNETGSISKALTRYVGGSHPTYVSDILVGYTNETLKE